MALYEIQPNQLLRVAETSFAVEQLKERQDLQRLLRDRVDIICPDAMILAEEFSGWDQSSRRIDLLALDKDANLVVIELKRTDDGGHMELQVMSDNYFTRPASTRIPESAA